MLARTSSPLSPWIVVRADNKHTAHLNVIRDLLARLLVVMYVKLASNEEREALASLGDDYRRYMADVPGFIPHLSRLFGGPARKRVGNG